MKRVFVLSFITTLLLASSGSLAQDVRYNFDKDTDFSKFKTYKWVAIKDAAKVSDLVDKQIKDAIDAELGDDDNQNRCDHYRILSNILGASGSRNTLTASAPSFSR